MARGLAATEDTMTKAYERRHGPRFRTLLLHSPSPFRRTGLQMTRVCCLSFPEHVIRYVREGDKGRLEMCLVRADGTEWYPPLLNRVCGGSICLGFAMEDVQAGRLDVEEALWNTSFDDVSFYARDVPVGEGNMRRRWSQKTVDVSEAFVRWEAGDVEAAYYKRALTREFHGMNTAVAAMAHALGRELLDRRAREGALDLGERHPRIDRDEP